MKRILYKSGFKYQLSRDYFQVNTGILPRVPIDTGYISLNLAGDLTISEGYAWDGPSGPAIDTLNFMRGSLVHDVFYQLMRQDFLIPEECREPADNLLRSMCLEDGMSRIRAWWVFTSVHWFASQAADHKNRREEISAP